MNSDRAKGVFQFFDSIYREADFPHYKSALKKTVKSKITELLAKIKKDEVAFAKTRSANRKQRLTASIAKKKKAITDWNAHLTTDTKLNSYYMKEWRTFHASDHLPLWVELEIDFSGAYLEYLKTV